MTDDHTWRADCEICAECGLARLFFVDRGLSCQEVQQYRKIHAAVMANAPTAADIAAWSS